MKSSSNPLAPRPRSTPGTRVGIERYQLLRTAFAHVQAAILKSQYLEAIAVLESILTDRMGSLVHGSLGYEVTLFDTLGRLVKEAKKNTVIPRNDVKHLSSSKRRSPLPPDVIAFVGTAVTAWWAARNHAVHGMAKLHHAGDATFAERYAGLAAVADSGVRVLLELDAFDQRERKKNGAGNSATWPDALKLDPLMEIRLSDLRTVVKPVVEEKRVVRPKAGGNTRMNVSKHAKRTDDYGRAFAGSQLQIQLHVNRVRTDFDTAIKAATGLSNQLEWVSPIISDRYKEYKDSAFLSALGLSDLNDALRAFWPSSGPRWDGLARVVGADPRSVILIEAKNYPREVRGGGCKASDPSTARDTIIEALAQTGVDLGIRDTNPWMGSLYQYANRLAHAAFLRRNGINAYMINVCFYDDPHPTRRTSQEVWREAAENLKREIGFVHATPSWLCDVFLPAVDKSDFLNVAP